MPYTQCTLLVILSPAAVYRYLTGVERGRRRFGERVRATASAGAGTKAEDTSGPATSGAPRGVHFFALHF